MRALLLYAIYSGQLFFVVIATLLAVITLDLLRVFDQRPRAKRMAGFLALLAIPLTIFTAPPFHFAITLPALAALCIYVLYGFGANARRVKLGTVVAISIIALAAFELPYHLSGSDAPRPAHLYVIGDSLSSGGFGEARTWPQLLAQSSGFAVKNLALASAHAGEAVERQLPELPPARRGDSVLIAIGGNDMLDGTNLERFEADLDRLITAARGGGVREVIVIELPLMPGRWSYGRVQRKLARKHQCVLLPKRIVASALVPPANTSDGLHLTQRGHAALAEGVGKWLRWTASGAGASGPRAPSGSATGNHIE